MTTFISLPAQDGVYEFDMPDYAAYHQMIPQFTTVPTAGHMKIEYKPQGTDWWFPVPEADNLDLSQRCMAVVGGILDKLRFTLTGMAGGAGLRVVVVASPVWPGYGGFPPGVFTGERALTVQFYPEANVKNGRQFYIRAVWPGLGPDADPIATGEAAARRIYFKTGPDTVIVKLRELNYIAELLRIRLFKSPTGVTGGQALTLHNYNAVNPYTPTGLQARKNVATTSNGVEFDGGDPEYLFGAASGNNRTQSSIPQGRERILSPNSEFIVEITNFSSGAGSAAQVSYYLDFYVGEPDLPID